MCFQDENALKPFSAGAPLGGAYDAPSPPPSQLYIYMLSDNSSRLFSIRFIFYVSHKLKIPNLLPPDVFFGGSENAGLENVGMTKCKH